MTSEGPAAHAARIRDELRFDYIFAALCGWYLLGLYVDGWAHNHIEGIETFYTPWHAIMYSGFLAVVAITAIRLGRARGRGLHLHAALPVGYGVALVGMVIYGIAGVGDLAWHTVFGVESNAEALFSPSHVGLLFGATLIRTGPLRAAWQRPPSVTPKGWHGHLPMLLSAAYLLSSLTFYTQYMHPFGRTLAAADYAPTVATLTLRADRLEAVEYLLTDGVAAIFLQTVTLMALLLMIVRRWGDELPFGSITLILTLNAALMVGMRDRYLSTGPLPLVAVAISAGFAGDLLLRYLHASMARTAALRAFAFALPAILWSLYFAAIFLFSPGMWWSLPVWTGLIVLAGAVGWLVSFLVAPPLVHALGEVVGGAGG